MAPGAWAINTQLGQMLPHLDCASSTGWTAGAAFAATVLALTGVLVARNGGVSTASRTKLFISRLNVFLGLAFAFALVLQGAATLLLSACER
ncbi:hypothetical protein NKH73_27850 [Mesorhizobium sp. M0938]|uniref:hypothetical protein n=1 Tax=unclassified Mesorhizobium TaxID=325217 RepID=UPI0033353DA3